MESTRLLDCLAADFARLREMTHSVSMDAPVPSCPGWTVADLTRHVGEVYLHKVECMRQGQRPQPWPPDGLATEEPLALLDRSYPALAAEFASRQPSSPAFTWYQPDQSVAFWIRRMAQETVIHRIDAELAAGAEVAPIPADLAADGIDEVLVAFLAYGSQAWPEEYAPMLAGMNGRSVRVQAPDSAWLVRLAAERVDVRDDDAGVSSAGTPGAGVDAATAGPDAVVSGEPQPLLRWLWNRGGADAVHCEGDDKTLADFRRVLVTSTQ